MIGYFLAFIGVVFITRYRFIILRIFSERNCLEMCKERWNLTGFLMSITLSTAWVGRYVRTVGISAWSINDQIKFTAASPPDRRNDTATTFIANKYFLLAAFTGHRTSQEEILHSVLFHNWYFIRVRVTSALRHNVSFVLLFQFHVGYDRFYAGRSIWTFDLWASIINNNCSTSFEYQSKTEFI